MPTWQSGFVLGLVSLTNRVVCNKYLSLITAYLKALRFFDSNMLKVVIRLSWMIRSDPEMLKHGQLPNQQKPSKH